MAYQITVIIEFSGRGRGGVGGFGAPTQWGHGGTLGDASYGAGASSGLPENVPGMYRFNREAALDSRPQRHAHTPRELGLPDHVASYGNRQVSMMVSSICASFASMKMLSALTIAVRRLSHRGLGLRIVL